MHNLAYLNASFQLSLVSAQISSIYLFSVLVQGYYPSPNITLSVLHVAAAFQELDTQTIINFVGCSPDIRHKDLWFTEGFLNERLL
jgi:hypothetical protein